MTVEQLNDELRQKLGVNPLYAWKRGADLYFICPVTNSDGSPQFDTVAYRGDDGEPTGVVGVQVKTQKVLYAEHYERIKPGVGFTKRWVFCRLQRNTMSPTEWRDAMGSMVPWVKEQWMPVDISGRGIGHLMCGHLMSDVDQPVSEQMQERAINLILMNKRFLERLSKRQLVDAIYDDKAEREKRIEQNTLYAMNKMPVGGWTRTPGEKDHISFPSVKVN